MCLPEKYCLQNTFMEKEITTHVIHMYLWSILYMSPVGVNIILMIATFIEVLGPGSVLIALYNLSQSTQQLSWENKVFIPILQMRNLGLGEAKPLTRGHRAGRRARINACNKMDCFSCTGERLQCKNDLNSLQEFRFSLK